MLAPTHSGRGNAGRVIVLAVVLSCLNVSAGFGQIGPQSTPAPPRPTGGVFGGAGNAPIPGGGPGLNLQISAYGGHDDDLSALQGGGGSGAGRTDAVGGYYGGLGGDLTFFSASPRLPVIVQAGTEVRRYEATGGLTAAQNRVSARFEPMIGRRWQLALGQSVDASPFYDFGLGVAGVEGPEVGTPADSRIALRSTLSLDSNSELRLQGTARTQFTVRYGFRSTRVADLPDFRSNRAGMLWRRQMTRYTGLRLGYEFEDSTGRPTFSLPGTPVVDAAIRLHNFDSGLDYRRPLSFSRRTTVGLLTGFALNTQLGRRFATVTGIGTLEHQIGRSWTATANVRRGMRVLQALGAPTLENTVGGQVNGLITARLHLLLSADYAAGQFNPGADAADTSYRTSSTTVRLRFALARFAAVYAEYGYYRSSFGGGVPFPEDFDSSVNRRSGRVGLTTSVPLVRQRIGRS